MFEQIGEKLSGMVAIPTVSGVGNEEEYRIGEYREYLKKEFFAFFSAVELIPVGEAMLLKLPGTNPDRQSVLFTGHMDVVPAQKDSWKYPPFSGLVRDGVVWGRGSQDMKGPQCALLSAADELVREGWRPEREIWFYLSCDEEVGGQTTEKAAALLARMNMHFETVFDEGGTICENYMGLVQGKAALFGIAEKGSLEYRFTALSEGGHSANPPKNSAIARIAGFVNEVESRDIFHKELGEGNRAMLYALADCAEGERKRELLEAAEEGGEHPVLHRLCAEADSLLGATIAFTMIEGGTAFNVMPKKAVLTANVRIPSGETIEEMTALLSAIAGKHGLVCELAGGREASRESVVDGSGYLAMKASVEEVYPNLPVIPFVLGGGTDSRHFQTLTDQVLRFSPMYAEPWQGRGVHGDNEAANIDALRDAAVCYYTLLKKRL